VKRTVEEWEAIWRAAKPDDANAILSEAGRDKLNCLIGLIRSTYPEPAERQRDTT